MADNQQTVRSQTSSESESESTSQISDPQQNTTNVTRPPVSAPRSNAQTLNVSGGVQTTSSFHSVSSIDSSAEMAKYFPDANSPRGSVYKEEKQAESQQVASYATVPAPAKVQQPLAQSAQAPVAVQQQQAQPAAAAPVLPQGIPAYSSQVEGLSVAQVVVNDVIIDLQSKVINETQQQYYEDSSSGNYLEQLPPIYIRAPNPSIILRSDLQRLRAQLTARPQVITRGASGFNQFQGPSFPPPNQYTPSSPYGGY